MLKKFGAAIFAAWVAIAGAQTTLNAVTGTITTQNLVSAGDCTAGSCVEIDVTGIASVTVQTKGTYTGALSAQVTTNRKDWVTECASSCTSTFTRRSTGVATATITSGEEDIYQVQFANGAKRLRITGLAAMTGTANITIQPSNVGAGSSSASGGGAGDASAANQTTMINSLSVLDDWDESDRAKVNIIAGQAGVAAGNGVSGATVPRVTIASDSTGQVALAAGSATIGALTANQSVNVAQMNGVATSMGAGVNGTGVQRVTIATDDVMSAAIVGVAHDAAAGSVNPALIGCYGSAAAPSDVSATNDATRAWCLLNGARAVQQTYAGVLATTGTGNSGTGVQRVVAATDQPAHALHGHGATGSAVPANATMTGGRSGANLISFPVSDTTAPITMSTATTTQMIALSGSTKTFIDNLSVLAGGTTNVTLVYGTGTNCATSPSNLTGAYPLTAQVGLVLQRIVVPAGQALCVTSSQAVQVSGHVTYTQFAP